MHSSTGASPFVGLARAAWLVVGLCLGGGACTCSKNGTGNATSEGGAAEARVDAVEARGSTTAQHEGVSAPIAAARSTNGSIVAAALDVPARAIRVQRISARDEVVAERTVLDSIRWSSEADLRLLPAGEGATLVWRGLRDGRLVRQAIVLDRDLAPKGDAFDVAAGWCATHDALWLIDGAHANARAWTGTKTHVELPKVGDASLICGPSDAFAVLDGDHGTSVIELGVELGDVRLGASAASASSAAAAAPASSASSAAAAAASVRSSASPRLAGSAAAPRIAPDAGAVGHRAHRLFDEADAADDDELREHVEYTNAHDFGIVRIASSGALAIREVRSGALQSIWRLRTRIGKDEDVVAVDASPRVVVIVFTEDATDRCASGGAPSSTSTRVNALRIDRATREESTFELSQGTCGRERGPYFTGIRRDDVSIAWIERAPVAGRGDAPIVGLTHALVPGAGKEIGPALTEAQPSDALVDAGCDGTTCYAAALGRRPGMDAMIPGILHVIRY